MANHCEQLLITIALLYWDQTRQGHDNADIETRKEIPVNMKQTQLKVLTSLIHLAFASLGVLAVFFLGAPSAKLAAAQNSCVVTVAAASDLTYAINEIAADFEKSAHCSVRVSYGSDQKAKRIPTVGATLLL